MKILRAVAEIDDEALTITFEDPADMRQHLDRVKAGEALERLVAVMPTNNWSMGTYTDEHGDEAWRIDWGYDDEGGGGEQACGATLQAAIDAALEKR